MCEAERLRKLDSDRVHAPCSIVVLTIINMYQ